MPPRLCSQPGCRRLSRARGLCKPHYNTARHHGTLNEHPTAAVKSTRKPRKSRAPALVRNKILALASDLFLKGQDAAARALREAAQQL